MQSGITRFRPRRAALILIALALAITWFAAPDLPPVAAAASDGHSSPVVSWAEPDNPGPNIEDYDRRDRISGSSGEFTEAEYAGDQTGGAITGTGLDANTINVAPGGGYNDPIGGTARVAAQAAEITLWSATLTVGKHSSSNIYGYSRQNS